VTGTSTLLGNLGVSGILEGDLKVDPASGELYYFWSNGSNFFVNAIDIDNVALSATAFWPFTGDASGAAFDNSGNLFILDTAADTLWLADKDTGVLYNPIPLSTQLGRMAGFAINPQTGEAWVADGGPTGTDKLYNLNLGTGELTMVGQTRFGGLTSLTFMSAPVLAAAESPEPGTLALLGTGLLGAAGMIRRRRRG
jgi:DNA-binding beta-propeller fold protein YncE